MLRIYFFDPIDQVLGDGRIVCSTSGTSLVNLIAKRPEDHRRIVAVTFYHGFDGKFCPGHGSVTVQDLIVTGQSLVKVNGEIVAVSVLCKFPSVKSFFDHQDTKLVTDINEIFIVWIVGGTD